MDPMETDTITDDSNSAERQGQAEGAESNVRPTLSQVKKSWGFRRTTIARREFMEEVGELSHSPPLVRRGRSRRANQTPQTTTETRTTRKATCTAKSVIDDLEWSSPSSPASEESKPASEASAGGSLDPSLWQDFGSAFHTAFSLLGGNEGLSMDMPGALAAPDILESTDSIEAPPPQAADETEVPDNMEPADDMEVSQPFAPDNVAGGDTDDVVLISSQEEDSDEMTLLQIKEQLASKSRQRNSGAKGGKGGRGKARGRGRGRGRGKGKGRGRGRGRGRAAELQSSFAHDVDNDDELVFVNAAEQQQQQSQEEENDPHSPAEIETSPACSDVALSPAQHSSSDCIIIDTDLDQIPDVTPGQYDDAPEEEQEEKDDKSVGGYSSISDTEGYDSNALYCICRQKHNKRFMICCDSCQDWFHGDCVGISETQGRKMEKKGQEYICPPCTTKKQLQSEPQLQPEPELSLPECVTLSSAEEGKGRKEQRALKESVVVVEEEEAPVMRPESEPVAKAEPEAEAEMETEEDSTLPLCIGPGCFKQALPDSVYCGTDCILQHAAVTMKTLSGPKIPKSKGRAQRKAPAARPTAKGQRSSRMSARLAAKAEEEEEDVNEDDGGSKEAASPLACDPSLTEVQATSIPSSKFYTASKKDGKQVEAGSEAVTPSTQSPEEASTDCVPASQPVTEPASPQRDSQEKEKEPVNSSVPKQQSAESDPSVPPTPENSTPSAATQSPTTSAPRHHGTGALVVTKTSYVIPKKQSGPQPLSGSASASGQKSSSAPTLLSETRNLLVPPAPSAPSSRPSQPNTQVRQSIQRSLTSILFKRVCDCEDLEMSESDAAKLVANIEMEMFDIFRNTDSKYMNKYRTIMFNLKDPRNKGLLYRVVHGEIGPFRLVRMSQKDMQATKAPEPSVKETPEVKDAGAKAASLQQKPEAVKVDLPSLNPTRSDRRSDKRPDSKEPKKSLPALKTRTFQPSHGTATPDILTCMLKDTTSEHKTHLFDLKCRICTGQIPVAEDEEPVKKKPKVSETRDKYEPSWRRSAGDDSPLRAPPDSPDMDSPTSILMESSSRLIIDTPALTIVESPASPIMDSPASPVLESPASPVTESPASPTPDAPKAAAPKRAYTPVVIPAVSTVTITRRDPRTAASRFTTPSSSCAGLSNTAHNQSASYAPLKETSSASPPVPAKKPLPKSILMKPSSSADPRLYGTSSRTVISESPGEGETTQFLAKQEILWKGFLNMVTVAKFVTKGYLVSGSAENLKADLPDTIQIGGRIMPQTVWDYVTKLKTSITKELCVIRFHPATEEEEVAYVSLFSYFSSRGRFGVVANSSHSIKDIYLVPLSAKESIPSILQPLQGPGLEKNRPNLLLGLAIVQRTKRPGSLPQEIEEKKPKVHMSKDPMWIPKPPVLYGSDKLEIFQPYDPETPASTTPPGSPSCPGSPSDSSSSGSVTVPSLLTSLRGTPLVSTSAVVTATQSNSNTISDNDATTTPSNKTPLQTILKTLFGNKQADSTVSSEGSSATTTVSAKKIPVFSQVSGSMVDPIVQQYGQKSKVKEMEEEENDFDRPYDPEEEYDPAMGYGMPAPQTTEKIKKDGPALSGCMDDDVAYDPEDETIFEDIQSDTAVTKAHTSDSSSCSAQPSTQGATSAATSTPVHIPAPAAVMPSLPTGTVVVSAATLTEQQRMLEELNKQIEEQKRQLKEQEEALRQQREAVGMFMAHFSVSDSLMSPPQKSLPLTQLPSVQGGITQTESRPLESTEKVGNSTETVDKSNVDTQSVKIEDTIAIPHLKNDTDTVTEQDETLENVEDSDKYSSAGEIEDSDIAYDPEDESLFNEIQEDVFQSSSIKTNDPSGHNTSHKGAAPNSHHSRKRRLSPKRRSHREKDCHRSPSRRSQRRSPSHSRRRRERDRHRRSERDRSRHRARNQSERQSRHRKEHSAHRHSRSRKKSPSSPRKKHSASLSPKQHRGPSPLVLEKSKHASIPCDASDSFVVPFGESNPSSSPPITIKNEPDGHQLNCKVAEAPDKDFPPHSHELHDNVKLNLTKPQDFQKTLVYDHNDRGDSAQANKPTLETLLTNKLDSTIPLREIDPPIRDSPQSPDPEPQFLKPGGNEKSDSAMTEEIRDSEIHTSASMPFVKVENNCPPIHDQTTVSNILWPTVGASVSDHRNVDFRALNLQGPGVRDQCMIEAGKQLKGESPGLRHSEMKGQGCRHSPLARGPDFQGSGPEIDPVINNPRNPGPDMKELGPISQQAQFRETGIIFPGPQVRAPGTQGMSPTIWGPGQYMQDPRTGLQTSDQNVIATGIRGGSGVISPIQDMESSRMQGMNSDVKGMCLDMRHSKPEMRGEKLAPNVSISHIDHRSELKNLDGRPCLMETQIDQSFNGPHTGGIRSAMMRGGLDPSLDSKRVQRQSRHDGSPVLEERGPQKGGYHPHERNADFSRLSQTKGLDSNASTGSEGRVLRSDRPPPSMTDESWGPLRGPGGLIRGPRSTMNYESGPSSMSYFGQECSGLGEQTDIRPERSVHGLQRGSETMHDQRRQAMTGQGFMGSDQDMDCMAILDPSNRGAGMQENNRQGPGLGKRTQGGQGGVGPDMRSQNKSLGPHTNDPDWNGPRSDITNDWRGPERRGFCSARGRPSMQDELRAHQSDRRDPIMGSQGPDFMAPGPGLEVPMHDRRGSAGPDLRRNGPDMVAPGPDRRYQDVWEPELERRGLSMEGPGIDRRGPEGPDFRGPGPGSRGPTMDGPGADRRGHPGPDFRGPEPTSRDLTMEGPGPSRGGPVGPDFSGSGPERRGLVIDSHGPDGRGPDALDFSGPGPDRKGPAVGGQGPERRESIPDFRGRGPERRGPECDRRGPSMEGQGPDWRSPGDQDTGRMGPDRRGPYMGGPGPHTLGQGGPHFSGPGPERGHTNMESPGPGQRHPEGPHFRVPRPERRPPDMECPAFDRRVPHFRREGPGRTVMEGQGKGPRDFKATGCEFRGLNNQGPGPDRREIGGADFREPVPERRGQDIGGPGPDWRRSAGPDLRQEGPRHDRGDDWGEGDFGGSELIQESQDLEMQGPERTGRHLRGPRSMRRHMRGPELDVSSLNQGDHWKSTGTGKQWLDGRGPNMEVIRNESEYLEDNWERQDNRGPPINEGLDEQGQEYGSQGPHSEWGGPEVRGPVPTQERPDMPFPGPVRGPGDDWSYPLQNDPDIMCPRPAPRGGPGNEWRESDRGSTGLNTRGRGSFFRGKRGPDRVQDHDRRGPSITGPGPDFQGGPDMANEWRQPGGNMEGPRAQRGGPDIRNSFPNRRGFEMERFNRMDPGGSGRQGFENDFRRERRGPDLRRPWPDKSSDMRRGPGRWDENPEFSGSHRRGPDIIGRPNDPHSALFNVPTGPNSGGESRLGFNSPQNQQIKPQRHRAALLPTPTEGLIRFPNRMISNPDVLSPKQKQIGYSTDSEWSRGRSVSRKRELDQGQKEAQEKRPVGKISTSVDANTGIGRGKRNKGNECDEQGVFSASGQTKANQGMNSDGNKSNAEPS